MLGGLSLFVLAGSAALSVLVLRGAGARTLMLTGVAARSSLGVTTTLVAVAAGSTVGFFAGTVIAGIGFGSGFQGGIRMVLPLVAPHERAGVLSLLYVVSYLGLACPPAIAAGYLVVHAGGLVVTAREYGIAVIATGGSGADRAAPPRGRGRAAAARRGGGLHGPGAMISEREGSRQVMATEPRTGQALGARAPAGRSERAVLRARASRTSASTA